MRRSLDESPFVGSGDEELELLEPMPAEIRRLVMAWRLLSFAAAPARGRQAGTRRGASESPIPDSARADLRKFKNTKRVEISRLVDDIVKRVREIKRCKTCGAENSWQDAYCGESLPEGKGCGALLLQKSPVRTKSSDA